MVEDYEIRQCTHTMVMTGACEYEITRSGTRRAILQPLTLYKTKAGNFEPDEWKRLALAEIERCGELELLEQVKRHCRKHCAWLHKENDLVEYAIECMCGRSYLYWEDWKETE